MRRKFSREIYVATLNPSSFPLQLKVLLLNRILKWFIEVSSLGIKQLLDKVEKECITKNQKIEREKSMKLMVLAAFQLIKLIIQMFYKSCICFAPAVTVLLWPEWTRASSVPVCHPRPGTALSSSQVRLGWTSCSQLSQRSKMPPCFLLKQHSLLHIVIFF